MAPSTDNRPDKHLILGTAGHVDHGKTTLIQALTGINADRLREEQERGMTIDLGFAHMRLPGGTQLGIVDVPGHERFLKNMLAGASGVDVVMLVIAADEGVMPQTREHLEILEMLETRAGVVALTKIDMVDAEWLEIVEDDVRQALKPTFLGDAPIVRVSGATGEGIDELVRVLDRLAEETLQRSVDGPFRLPVDRVFTITGFGTVLTGTLVSGTLRLGDPVTVLPQGLETRVRQIQVHGKKQDVAYAGSRVAVNLVGVDVEDLGRGSVVLPPGYLQASSAMDVSVSVLPAAPRPLYSRTRVRIHIGSAEAIGRASVLGAEELAPGSKGMVQLRLETPVVAARGDRFVLRFYSPTRLLGGGVVLDPAAKRHKRHDAAIIARLQRALKGDPVDIVQDAIAASESGLIRPDIVRRTGLSDAQVVESLRTLSDGKQVIERAGRYLTTTGYQGMAARVRSTLEAYHKANPTRAGMPREELRAQLGSRMDQKGFQAIISIMAENGDVVPAETTVRLAGHQPTMSSRQQQLAAVIETQFREAAANPPLMSEAEKQHGQDARDVLALMIQRGVLVRIAQDVLFHREAIETIEQKLRAFLADQGQMTVAQFRDEIGSSRKYAVPLLEYFDQRRVTRRTGDLRSLA